MQTQCSGVSKVDFIGVGPEKTGTSWIDVQLRAHRNVWVPPLKELRFFWEDQNFPCEHPFVRLVSRKDWHSRQYRGFAKRLCRKLLREPRQTLRERDELLWALSYLFRVHDEVWYLSCFTARPGRLNGEISAPYFFLPIERIRKVHALAPDAKILVTLRHPVDWVWSFARMIQSNGRLQERYGDLDAFFEAKMAAGSYSDALERWLLVFGRERLATFFYDQLEAEPWQFYSSICAFLGIDHDHERAAMLSQRVNIGRKWPIEERHVRRIRDLWREDMRKLAAMTRVLPPGWLSD
jgi:hypothetical protein